MPETITVSVKSDHLEGLIHSGQPERAVSELVWNALDADSTLVRVSVIENGLGGIDSIRVEDNGTGMTVDEARSEFASLGGSWKRYAERTRQESRYLHGKEGRGRWRAYALGTRVAWTSVTEDSEGGRQKVEITGRRAALGQFVIGDPESTDEPRGTVVTIEQIEESALSLLAPSARLQLTGEFANYLEQYPVEIIFRGTKLDPTLVQSYRKEYEVEVPDSGGETAQLMVIEWTEDVDRAIYLCDGNGAALERLKAGIHAPGFDFTAYLKWNGFSERRPELALAELGAPGLSDLLEAARDVLREHFKQRSGEVTKALIQDWKSAQVYPYTGEPQTTVEAATRDLFDVVALAAAPAVNRSSDAVSRKLTLRLISEALEQNPSSLGKVLHQVLDLSDEKLEELEALLRRTPLTSLITAAKRIADRLDFLQALDLLLFDTQSKRGLLERSQMHRILVGETWVFGEEYNLMADDQSLTQVLKAHVKHLGRSELVPGGPVVDNEGKTRIVDLAFGRALQLNTNRREHLVVELKRPATVLGQKELAQIQGYAAAVAADDRFSKTQVSWDFYLIGNSYEDVVKLLCNQRDKPPGLAMDSDGIRVWVKTWSQVVAEVEHRLKYVKGALEYSPTDEQALEYLRQTHGKYLPENLAEHEIPSPQGSDWESAALPRASESHS